MIIEQNKSKIMSHVCHCMVYKLVQNFGDAHLS